MATLFKHSALGLRLIALVLLSVILMSYDHNHHQLHRLRNTLSAVVAPVQYMVAWPVEMAGRIKDSVIHEQGLLEENASLRAENLLLKAKMQRILSLKTENQQLRALLQSAAVIDESFAAAKLLAVSNDPYVAEIVIDKGHKQGAFEGQAVLDASGVMGQVIHVGPLTSRVMLVTDSRSAIPVQNSRTGARGIMTGTGPWGALSLLHMAESSDIKSGDILTTSGLGLRYPEGFPVGIVREIKQYPGDNFLTISVDPSAHLQSSRQILLVGQRNRELTQQAKQDLAQIANETVS